MKRLYCLWLLLKLPFEGLNELEEDLISMGDFYRKRQDLHVPEPESVKTISGTIIREVKREPFVIDFDE